MVMTGNPGFSSSPIAPLDKLGGRCMPVWLRRSHIWRCTPNRKGSSVRQEGLLRFRTWRTLIVAGNRLVRKRRSSMCGHVSIASSVRLKHSEDGRTW